MNSALRTVPKPLTLRLFKRILLFSAALILLLACGRAWWEYRTVLDAVYEELAVIGETKAKSVAASLWDFDREQLILHVEGIRHFRHISYASVSDTSGVLASAGARRSSGVLDREFPLFTFYNGQRQVLGVLHVQADLEEVRRLALEGALRGLSFNAALVLLVAGLVFWLTSSMISRHLAAFALHFQSYSLGGGSQPLALDKKPAGDELDVLAGAVNTMQDGLAASYAQVLEAQSEVKSLARFPQENPSPILRAGSDGMLLKSNPASVELLEPWGVVVGRKLPETFAAVVSRALASGEVQRLETDFGGRNFAFVASPVPAEGYANLYGMDITRRVRAEEEVRRNVTRLQCLVRVLQHKAKTAQEFLDFCLAEALALTESRFGCIYRYSEERQEFAFNACSCEGECTIPRATRLDEREPSGIWDQVVRLRKPVVHNDLRGDNPFAPGSPEGRAGLRTIMSVPVFYGGRIVAVAGMANREGGYQDGDVLQLSLLMDACWQVVARLEAEADVLRSLHEKEVLLKEIHHRVKNNLQIISSLLFLQAEYVIEPLDKTMFEESQKRISAMALVHEELYGSGDLASVGMKEYVPRLVDRVVAGTNVPVDLEYDVEDLRLPVTHSIPCGLVLNELVMNAVKHAFRGRRGALLRISLARKDGQVELAVEDNGPGLPGNFDLENSTTLGLNLISSLARQLSGSVQAQSLDTGARFTLRFPLEGH